MTKNDFYELVMEAYKPAETLIGIAPADKLEWRPGPSFMSLGQVIEHVSHGLGDDVRCLITNHWPFTPEQMVERMKLENMAACSVQEALERIRKDRSSLREVIDGLSEKEFTEKVVSTPWGWSGKLERMLVLFREHFTNHKMQLFTYLKLLGLPVNTETLYGG